MAEQITYADFQKLDLRIVTVLDAQKVEGKDKLLVLKVSLGEEERQLVAGIAPWYTPEELIGKQIPILANLEPKNIGGIESQGMILAIDVEGKAVLLVPERKVTDGSVVR